MEMMTLPVRMSSRMSGAGLPHPVVPRTAFTSVVCSRSESFNRITDFLQTAEEGLTNSV